MTPIIQHIIEVAPGFHSAGPLSPRVLEAIAEYCQRLELHHTVETGCGASTLLFSNISQHHTVFADARDNDSLERVKRSHLLRPEVVSFVEGPTQLTLPRHDFKNPLDCVLLDGPHAYPFPDLEYYYLYPKLTTGALFILDDIHIPTIYNLFSFMRSDSMFRFQRVIGTTAIFRRTNAPTFNPLGDGWWSQRYNDQVLLRYAWRDVIKDLLPRGVKAQIRYLRQLRATGWGPRIRIVSPERGEPVGPTGLVTGIARLPDGWKLWVLVRRKDLPGWWPQGGGPVDIENGTWRLNVCYGADRDIGFHFEICALAIRGGLNCMWLDWTKRASAREEVVPVSLPPAAFVLGERYRTVYRKFRRTTS
jgi:hypothetical protein